jgi:hypothetical protein
MKKMTALVIALGMAANASASSIGPALPSFLTYRSDGVAFVYLSGTRTGTIPACASPSGNYHRFAINSTTPAGKSQLAGLIAAHAAGETIWLTGTGDCGVLGDTESVSEFHTGS